MSECKLDHSHEDVRKKYEEQSSFLPEEVESLFKRFFAIEHPQPILNEVFHLLKKYDLASEEEKKKRNEQLNVVINNRL
ncbi:group-specific protein [Bacillus sp. B15-48]|uniref:group-specific protein n=1 Tax=Bacillus sp. B15-48 TaxID=1548601 RepID=UPI00193F0630|nr:group-specific protein [Bacillus sp. B15-48]MBM4762788.1 group-specific protein [Bacillus sp. B15-48]